MSDRAYIPYPERLAASLACLLPQDVRDQLRRDKVPAEQVISRFHFHHIEHHAGGGADDWHNLDPQRIDDHKERTAKIDIPAIAKVKRLSAEQEEHRRRMLLPASDRKEQKRSRWAKGRKIPSRGFERRR